MRNAQACRLPMRVRDLARLRRLRDGRELSSRICAQKDHRSSKRRQHQQGMRRLERGATCCTHCCLCVLWPCPQRTGNLPRQLQRRRLGVGSRVPLSELSKDCRLPGRSMILHRVRARPEHAAHASLATRLDKILCVVPTCGGGLRRWIQAWCVRTQKCFRAREHLAFPGVQTSMPVASRPQAGKGSRWMRQLSVNEAAKRTPGLAPSRLHTRRPSLGLLAGAGVPSLRKRLAQGIRARTSSRRRTRCSASALIPAASHMLIATQDRASGAFGTVSCVVKLPDVRGLAQVLPMRGDMRSVEGQTWQVQPQQAAGSSLCRHACCSCMYDAADVRCEPYCTLMSVPCYNEHHF